MTEPADVVVACVKLAKPAERALAGAGIVTFADLAGWRAQDLAALHGIGPTALRLLVPALAERGLQFRTP